MKSNGFTPPERRYASIHPFNRKMEWRCKRRPMDWLHDDICPTVTANEFRGVGNVIWEIYETDKENTDNGRQDMDVQPW